MAERTLTFNKLEQELIVPGAHGRAFEVKAGQYVALTQIEGNQVGDLVALSLNDLNEYLSTCYTVSTLRRLTLQVGDMMYTNRRNPVFEIVKDDVGVHDLLLAACDSVRYEQLGAPGHRNCLDNMTEALTPYGIAKERVPFPFNTFQNTPVGPDGNIEVRPSPAGPGDQLILKALMDLVVVVSCCPMDLSPLNAGRSKDLKVSVYS